MLENDMVLLLRVAIWILLLSTTPDVIGLVRLVRLSKGKPVHARILDVKTVYNEWTPGSRNVHTSGTSTQRLLLEYRAPDGTMLQTSVGGCRHDSSWKPGGRVAVCLPPRTPHKPVLTKAIPWSIVSHVFAILIKLMLVWLFAIA